MNEKIKIIYNKLQTTSNINVQKIQIRICFTKKNKTIKPAHFWKKIQSNTVKGV